MCKKLNKVFNFQLMIEQKENCNPYGSSKLSLSLWVVWSCFFHALILIISGVFFLFLQALPLTVDGL